MKKNNIIIASVLSAAPLVFWGIRSVVKNPKFQKVVEEIKRDEMKRVAETLKPIKKEIREDVKAITGRKKAKARSSSKRKRSGEKTVYEGAKGGRYTIGKNGKKLYLKNKE